MLHCPSTQAVRRRSHAKVSTVQFNLSNWCSNLIFYGGVPLTSFILYFYLFWKVLSSKQIDLLPASSEPLWLSQTDCRKRPRWILPRDVPPRTTRLAPPFGSNSCQGNWIQVGLFARHRTRFLFLRTMLRSGSLQVPIEILWPRGRNWRRSRPCRGRHHHERYSIGWRASLEATLCCSLHGPIVMLGIVLGDARTGQSKRRLEKGVTSCRLHGLQYLETHVASILCQEHCSWNRFLQPRCLPHYSRCQYQVGLSRIGQRAGMHGRVRWRRLRGSGTSRLHVVGLSLHDFIRGRQYQVGTNGIAGLRGFVNGATPFIFGGESSGAIPTARWSRAQYVHGRWIHFP